VKRLSADDSAGSRVKVGHRQASNSPKRLTVRWGVLLCAKHFFNALFLPYLLALYGLSPD
jgi:hypothetical protein